MKRNLILLSLIVTGLVISCGSDDKKTTPKKPQVKAEVTETTEVKKPKIEDIDYGKQSLDNAQTEEDHAVRETVLGSLEMITGYLALKSANIDSKVSQVIHTAKTDMVTLAKVDNLRMQAYNRPTAPKLQASIEKMYAIKTKGGKRFENIIAQIEKLEKQVPTAFKSEGAKTALVEKLSRRRNALFQTAKNSNAALKALPATFEGLKLESYKAVSSGQYARNAARGVAGKTVRLLVKGVAVVAIAEGATRIVMQFTDGIEWLSDYLPGNYVVRVLTGFTHSDRGDIPAAE